jgi:hypothetical protein
LDLPRKPIFLFPPDSDSSVKRPELRLRSSSAKQ